MQEGNCLFPGHPFLQPSCVLNDMIPPINFWWVAFLFFFHKFWVFMLSKIVYGIDACNVVHSLTFIHESGKPWASQVLTAIWMKSIWMNLLQSCLELAESFFISCSAFTASQIKLVISVVSTQSLPSHNVISNVCPYLRIIIYNGDTKSKLQRSIRASSTVYDVLHCIFFIFG